MSAQTVVITGGCNSRAKELLIFIHTLNECRQEHHKLGVLPGGFSGAEKVSAGVGSQGPVIVLAGAVYTLEGLFVEQTDQVVLCSALFHNLHRKLVCIAGIVGIRIDGGQFVLAGSSFVVLCFGKNTQTPKLFVQVLHKVRDPGANGAKIVVIQFLTLGRQSAEQGAPGEAQVRPLCIHILGKQEIFLFCANTGGDSLCLLIAKQAQNSHCLLGNLINRTEQGSLFVKGSTCIGEETGGDIQAAISYKSERGGVPGSVAPGFKGSPQTAGGERRCVRLASNQSLAFKFHNNPAFTGRFNKRVMLFGGNASHRLEPVGVVGSALFQSPNFHSLSNFIGNIQLQRGAILDAKFPGVINFGP